MTVEQLLNNKDFTLINAGDLKREITSIYCCDLLSIVMGRAVQNCAWVTVMGNINAVAVAVLADIGVVVLAEGIEADPITIEKAKAQNVNLVKTSLPIYEAAVLIGKNV